jgi:adenylate cyclase
MERRLAAILAADVVGYSRLMGADEAGTLARLKACEADVIEPAVAHHGGRIVKRMGDGYLVEFASVVAALDCAMAWQAGAGDPLAFRIGIHLGDVIVQEGDLYGEGVNVAARLEALAEPGGVCVSEDAQRQVRGKTAAQFQDMGPQDLKNIAEPLRVYRATTMDRGTGPGRDAAGTSTSAATAHPWRLPRVLLVPFRHLGSHGDAEALASGLTETLAAALAHFEEFELIDPGGAREAHSTQGAPATGRQSDATYLLEGSVQLALGKARIGVQLIEVTSGRRVWSQTLDRGLDDVFALQDDITAFVASTMGEAVGEEQARAIAHKTPDDLRGFETVVRGIQHLHRVNPEDNQVARRYFEKAIAQNPGQYFPELCLGWTYAIELANGWLPSRDDALDYALGLIGDLLRRHERSAHAHRLMSRLLLLAGNHDQALAHAERCHRLNPFHGDMVMSYGFALMWCGHANEGLEKLERAFAINPYAPAFYKAYLSLAYYLTGRHEDGLAILESVEGAVGPSRYARIANMMALGRTDDARAEARALRKKDPDFDLGRLLAGMPFKRPDDRQRFADALRSAGL